MDKGSIDDTIGQTGNVSAGEVLENNIVGMDEYNLTPPEKDLLIKTAKEIAKLSSAKYPETKFTRATGRFCDGLDRYVGIPIANFFTNGWYYVADFMQKRGWAKYHDKHGNVVDKYGKIVENGTPINRGSEYKKNKKAKIKGKTSSEDYNPFEGD